MFRRFALKTLPYLDVISEINQQSSAIDHRLAYGRSDDPPPLVRRPLVLVGRRVPHGCEAAFRVQRNRCIARQGASVTVPGKLCRVFGDIADSFVFRLCSLLQLLSRGLSDQVSHRIPARHASGHSALRLLPCALDEARIFGAEAREPLPRERTDIPGCFVTALFVLTTLVDIPAIEIFTGQRYISFQ